MSEFSESYHLRAGDQHEGVALLERSSLPGWAFPPAGGWVTVVVDRDFTSDPDPALVAANTGLLVLYVNAEDHGWSLTVWEGPDEQSHYQAEWTFDLTTDTSRHHPAELRRLLAPDLPDDRLDRLDGLLAAPIEEDDFDRWVDDGNPGHQAARLLGLPNADWMSAAALRHGADDRLAGAVRIGGT